VVSAEKIAAWTARYEEAEAKIEGQDVDDDG
jgi:hypothetical protein